MVAVAVCPNCGYESPPRTLARRQVYDSPALDTAASFLWEMLADGPILSANLNAEAARRGIATNTLRRARAKIGVTSYRVGFGRGGQMFSKLAGQIEARPEPPPPSPDVLPEPPEQPEQPSNGNGHGLTADERAELKRRVSEKRKEEATEFIPSRNRAWRSETVVTGKIIRRRFEDGHFTDAELSERAEKVRRLIEVDDSLDPAVALSYVIWPSEEMEALFAAEREQKIPA
jgi:hypothetical protein